MWFILALVATILWAGVNLADKYLLEHHTEDEGGEGALIIFSTLSGFIIVALIAIFSPSSIPVDSNTALIGIATGIGFSLSILLYLKALKDEDVSFVVPFFQLIPVFGYIAAYFVLGEQLTTTQILWGLVIIVGAMIMSFEFTSKIVFKLWPVLLMTLSGIIIALTETFFKDIALDHGFATSLFWNYVGAFILGIICFIYTPYRKEFIRMMTTAGKKVFGINMTSEVVTLVGNVMFAFATLLAPLALVMLVNSFQPVIVFVVAQLLMYLKPGLVPEKVSGKEKVIRTCAIVLIVIGTIGISY